MLGSKWGDQICYPVTKIELWKMFRKYLFKLFQEMWYACQFHQQAVSACFWYIQLSIGFISKIIMLQEGSTYILKSSTSYNYYLQCMARKFPGGDYFIVNGN